MPCSENQRYAREREMGMDRRAKLNVAILCFGALMVGTDFTGALMLVVPIEHEYSADITTTQWVLNVYALTFAMLIVTGGRLGDMFGRRRLLLIGLAIFAGASLVCTLAPSIGWLIGARAVQGVGSAIVWPCIIGLGATVVEEEDRGFAMGLIIGATASGNVIGPVVSGVVTGLGEWRLFFLINLIMAAITALLIWWLLDKKDEKRVEERIDYGGMVVLSIAILALLYALDVGADWGWGSLPIIGLFVACGVMIVAFPFVEGAVKDPMVPPALIRNKEFLLTLSTNGLIVPSFFLAFLYFPQYMHNVLGWSVLVASFGMLPMTFLIALVSTIAGRYYNQFGPRRLLFVGYALATLGTIAAIFFSSAWGYAGLLLPMVLIGIGAGIAVGPAGTAAVSAVDESRAGLAGGLAFMFHLGFGAIGVAGGTAIMYGTSLGALSQGLKRSGINMSPADQAALNAGTAQDEVADKILSHYSAADHETIHAALSDAFAVGLHSAYWLVLVALFIGLAAIYFIDESKLRGADA